MKENDNIKGTYKDLLILFVTIVVCLLICNMATPYFYRSIKADRYRTTLILDALKDSSIKPDIVVFGSSTSMMGIDGYQMSDELNQEVYNFSSVGQSPVESSLYYNLLPTSVKVVIQIISPPILDHVPDINTPKIKIGEQIATSFSMSGYQLSDDIVNINKCYDLSELSNNFLLRNYFARASIIIPALTYAIIPRDKNADQDLKFCNSYLTSRHKQYARTIEQLKSNSFIGKEYFFNNAQLNTLNEYSLYLCKRNIKTVFVLMPSNPDLERYSQEQVDSIGRKCKDVLKNAVVLNYLDVFSDSECFFDAAHMNKEGAKVLTGILDEDLMKLFNKSSFNDREFN